MRNVTKISNPTTKTTTSHNSRPIDTANNHFHTSVSKPVSIERNIKGKMELDKHSSINDSMAMRDLLFFMQNAEQYEKYLDDKKKASSKQVVVRKKAKPVDLDPHSGLRMFRISNHQSYLAHVCQKEFHVSFKSHSRKTSFESKNMGGVQSQYNISHPHKVFSNKTGDTTNIRLFEAQVAPRKTSEKSIGRISRSA